jgi:hypothetical protein
VDMLCSRSAMCVRIEGTGDADEPILDSQLRYCTDFLRLNYSSSLQHTYTHARIYAHKDTHIDGLTAT